MAHFNISDGNLQIQCAVTSKVKQVAPECQKMFLENAVLLIDVGK